MSSSQSLLDDLKMTETFPMLSAEEVAKELKNDPGYMKTMALIDETETSFENVSKEIFLSS